MFAGNINGESRISVTDFVKNASAGFDVEVLKGANGLRQRQIVSFRIKKLVLVLVRFSHYIHAEERIQIVGDKARFPISHNSKAGKNRSVRQLRPQ